MKEMYEGVKIEKKVIDYLKGKYEGLESVENKYSSQYGWEYHIIYNVSQKEILSQHRLKTMMQEDKQWT